MRHSTVRSKVAMNNEVLQCDGNNRFGLITNGNRNKFVFVSIHRVVGWIDIEM
jgi:hypothetical protein